MSAKMARAASAGRSACSQRLRHLRTTRRDRRQRYRSPLRSLRRHCRPEPPRRSSAPERARSACRRCWRLATARHPHTRQRERPKRTRQAAIYRSLVDVGGRRHQPSRWGAIGWGSETCPKVLRTAPNRRCSEVLGAVILRRTWAPSRIWSLDSLPSHRAAKLRFNYARATQTRSSIN